MSAAVREALTQLGVPARLQGVSSIRLRTNVVRKGAHAFYEHVGYVVRKEQKVYVKVL